ncbi:hypothetical protein DPMN_010398 [Dreissena polymorpha]|uniref:Uncharacterized protein n=1 Tax=Dreissena polymorpha TaxID=45954 RepID=A0A9D4N455_DREPO|nr:hypothetical protein DPMN_010398 [Dreissena polymorpha]
MAFLIGSVVVIHVMYSDKQTSRCLYHVTFSAMCGTISCKQTIASENNEIEAQDIIRTNVRTKFHEEIDSPTNAPPHDIIGTNLVTMFHEDRTEAPRVKNAPPHCSKFSQQTRTIFELVQDIIRTNVLTKFHEDWTINVTFRVFKLSQAIFGSNLLTKFHDDSEIHLESRVYIR